MHRVVCAQGRRGADWLRHRLGRPDRARAVALQGRAVRVLAAASRQCLYVGTWDHGVHAINAKTGKRIWPFQADDEVNTSAAYWKGRIFIALGQRHALLAQRQDRQADLEQAQPRAHEFFYATPTIALRPRVHRHHRRHDVRVRREERTSCCGRGRSAATSTARRRSTSARSTSGTYDGKFYALDAATGDVRWQIDAHGAVHAAPAVMSGLVYYAICSTCGSAAQRSVASGPDATTPFSARRQAGVELPGRQVRQPDRGRQGAHVPHGTGAGQYAFAEPRAPRWSRTTFNALVKGSNALSHAPKKSQEKQSDRD